MVCVWFVWFYSIDVSLYFLSSTLLTASEHAGVVVKVKTETEIHHSTSDDSDSEPVISSKPTTSDTQELRVSIDLAWN